MSDPVELPKLDLGAVPGDSNGGAGSVAAEPGSGRASRTPRPMSELSSRAATAGEVAAMRSAQERERARAVQELLQTLGSLPAQPGDPPQKSLSARAPASEADDVKRALAMKPGSMTARSLPTQRLRARATKQRRTRMGAIPDVPVAKVPPIYAFGSEPSEAREATRSLRGGATARSSASTSPRKPASPATTPRDRATPIERIAGNYSLKAGNLSPRTFDARAKAEKASRLARRARGPMLQKALADRKAEREAAIEAGVPIRRGIMMPEAPPVNLVKASEKGKRMAPKPPQAASRRPGATPRGGASRGARAQASLNATSTSSMGESGAQRDAALAAAVAVERAEASAEAGGASEGKEGAGELVVSGGAARQSQRTRAAEGYAKVLGDSEFLALDVSALPLEKFDSADFETRTPKEWLLLGPTAAQDRLTVHVPPAELPNSDGDVRTVTRSFVVPEDDGDGDDGEAAPDGQWVLKRCTDVSLATTGITPRYSDGEWSWDPCAVIGYYESDDKYMVRFWADGYEKQVSRLNLKFDAEEDWRFWGRREFAEKQREKTMMAIRYYYFLAEHRPGGPEVVTPLAASWEEAILHRAIGHLNAKKLLASFGPVAAGVVREIRHGYLTALKHAIVAYELLDVALHPRFLELRLPLPADKAKAKSHGLVPVPERLITFSAARGPLSGEFDMMIKRFHRSVLGLMRRWFQDFAHQRIIDNDVAMTDPAQARAQAQRKAVQRRIAREMAEEEPESKSDEEVASIDPGSSDEEEADAAGDSSDTGAAAAAENGGAGNGSAGNAAVQAMFRATVAGATKESTPKSDDAAGSDQGSTKEETSAPRIMDEVVAMTLPCDIHDFEKRQQLHAEDLIAEMKQLWHKEFVLKFSEVAARILDLFTDDRKVFDKHYIRRLLFRVRLQMAEHLRQIAVKSINDFVHSISLFAVESEVSDTAAKLFKDLETWQLTEPEVLDRLFDRSIAEPAAPHYATPSVVFTWEPLPLHAPPPVTPGGPTVFMTAAPPTPPTYGVSASGEDSLLPGLATTRPTTVARPLDVRRASEASDDSVDTATERANRRRRLERPPRPALFKISLLLKDGKICFFPRPRAVERTLCNVLQLVPNVTSSFREIGPQVFNMLDLTEARLFPMNRLANKHRARKGVPSAYPVCDGAHAAFDAATHWLKQLVRRDMEGPLAVAERYAQYTWLTALTPTGVIESLHLTHRFSVLGEDASEMWRDIEEAADKNRPPTPKRRGDGDAEGARSGPPTPKRPTQVGRSNSGARGAVGGKPRALGRDGKPVDPGHMSEEQLAEARVQREKAMRAHLRAVEQQELERFVKAADAIERLSYDCERAGMFEVNTSPVKSRLVTAARSLAEGIMFAIVRDCRRIRDAIHEQYETIKQRIEEKPTDARGLDSLRKFMKNCARDVTLLTEATNETLERLDGVERFHHRVSPEDIQAVWRLHLWPQQVLDAEGVALHELEQLRYRLMAELDVEKGKFEKHMTTLPPRVEEFRDFGVEHEVWKIAEKANDLRNELEKVKATLADFNEREDIFGLTRTEYPELVAVLDAFAPHYDLWTMCNDFDNNRTAWRTGVFLELKANAINSQVEEWLERAAALELELSGTPAPLKVVERFIQDVKKFSEFIPMIDCLANEALQDRHWLKLSGVMNVDPPIDHDESLTLDALLELGVMDYMEQIEDISLVAGKEYALEVTLRNMREQWSSLKFVLPEYKDTGTYIVSDVQDILDLLDDHIVKTQTIRGSPFVRAIEEDCRKWEAKLLDGVQLIEAWMLFQRTWTYLQPIFSSEDIMRQMPTEARKFERVDGLWRRTMAQVYQFPRVMDVLDSVNFMTTFEHANAKLDEIQKGLNEYLELKRRAFPRFYFLSNDELLEILADTKDPRAVQPHLNKSFEGIASLDFTDDETIVAMRSAEGERVPFEEAVDPNKGARKGNVELWMSAVEEAMRYAVQAQCTRALQKYSAKKRQRWVTEWPAQVVLAISQVDWTFCVEHAIRTRGTAGLREYEQTLNDQLNDIVGMVRRGLEPAMAITLGALTTIDVHARDVVHTMADNGTSSISDFDWFAQLRYYWREPKKKDGGGGGGFGGTSAKGAARRKRAAAARKRGKGLALGVAGDDAGELDGDLFPGAQMEIKIVNARQVYGWEYLGNTGRLVITPLTDRCYRTLMGAITLTYGGAPEGPAGTGKTESTKDLAKALAMQCVVFNCSDGLDYLAMAKFFKGLAASGAWSCFDEFNRIELEVLSVIAQQILTIQQGKQAGTKRIVFEGANIDLRRTCNVFITMNPGYAGRSELPDNLKALFRPCAMMVPDYALIAEIVLYSYGFSDARNMARKVTQVLRLASEQLSSQFHYDYGMRAVKTILVAAGNLKRKHPRVPEDQLTLRAINDVNLPKFTTNDLPLFAGITSDLFPETEDPDPDYGALADALGAAAQDKELAVQAHAKFVQKCQQLYETVAVRHGLMVVGQALSGKSCVIKCLAKALDVLAKKDAQAELVGEKALDFDEGYKGVVMQWINPKSLPQNQLYGFFDENTREWSDGVLAVSVRKFSRDRKPTRKWTVFDGPVDAVWIENMNTVLDDNKKLCLNSGEIIKLSSAMTMMFEVGDLSQASPATVSRCGMVYLEPSQLGWEPLKASWLEKLPAALPALEGHVEHIGKLLDAFLPDCLEVAEKAMPSAMDVMPLALVTSMFNLLLSLLRDVVGRPSDDDDEAEDDAPPADELGVPSASPAKVKRRQEKMFKDTRLRIEGAFIFALVWSVGANSDETGRAMFDLLLRKLAKAEDVTDLVPSKAVSRAASRKTHREEPAAAASAVDAFKLSAKLPSDGLLYDYFFDAVLPKQKAAGAAALASGNDASKKTRGTWKPWMKTVPAYDIPSDARFESIIVPTMETTRNARVMSMLVADHYHVLAVGETGTGKSATIATHLKALDSRKFSSLTMMFSARTGANQTHERVISALTKRRQGIWGPAFGKRAVIFVDDLNMPAKEKYGAQPPIELLRQWMDHGGWYSHVDKGMPFRKIQDIQFVAAMAPPGGGRNTVTQRYLRHFHVLPFLPYSTSALNSVFGAILEWYMEMAPRVTRQLSSQIVKASVQLYNVVIANCRPTPAKTHYTFNLRDLSKVFQGITSADKKVLDSPRQLLLLWAHECRRVFSDRLVDQPDRDWFQQAMETEMRDSVGQDWEEVGGGSTYLTFADCLDWKAMPVSRSYVQITDESEFRNAMNAALTEYNTGGKGRVKMPLVMFRMAREHVARVSRVLRQPSGHALLVGVGGSGRRSLTRLAAFVSHCTVSTVEVTKLYGVNEWQEDLRGFMKRAGLDNKRTVLLLPDSAIVDEAMLEDVNSILNSGEVPNLFSDDDLSTVLDSLSDSLKTRIPKTNEALYEEFVRRCRANLHVVLTFSPVGDAFRRRLRQFPSLINCCYIDWFPDWPEEGLRSVAEVVLRTANADIERRQQTLRDRLQDRITSNHAAAKEAEAAAAAAAAAAVFERGDDAGNAEEKGTEDTAAAPQTQSTPTERRSSIKDFEEKVLDPLEEELEQLVVGPLFPKDLTPGVVNVCVAMHQRAVMMAKSFEADDGRYYHVTPTSYLDLLNSFIRLLDERQKVLTATRQRYAVGVGKIRATEKMVHGMKQELIHLQPILEASTRDTAELMEDIKVKREAANQTRATVAREEEICSRQAAEAQAMKDECEADLAKVLPILKSAVAALKTLTKQDLAVVKGMKKPPKGVRIVMEAVCIILKVKPVVIDKKAKLYDYWAAAQKSLLNDMRFLKRLATFDKDKLSDKVVAALQPYIDDPDFVPDVVARSSSAAEGLCKWVRAMVVYRGVAKVVEPKRRALKRASAELEEAESALASKKAELQAVEQQIADYMKRFDVANAKKTALEEEVAVCKVRLERATALTEGLAGEKERWSENIVELDKNIATLLGDVLLSSSFVAYLGAFTSPYRAASLEAWSDAIEAAKLPHSPRFSLLETLSDQNTKQDWIVNGLPSDNFSSDNAVSLLNSSRWPLLIDPQGQGLRWITKQLEADGVTLHRVKHVEESSTILRTLERAVTLGEAVLVEGVGDEVDPSLAPLLLKEIQTVGGHRTIRLGESTVAYNDSFRMFLTTELPNPHYSPETCVMVNLLNFVATDAGLRDQMLGLVVGVEHADQEHARIELLQQTAENNKALQGLEDRILELLNTPQSEILESDTLVQTLKDSQETSSKIKERMAAGARMQKKISATRTALEPVAIRAATVYFTIADLARIDPMYQYSLEWFTRLFRVALKSARKPTGSNAAARLAARIESLKDNATQLLFTSVCRSLFERHKLLFATLLAMRISEVERGLDIDEIRVFLVGSKSMEAHRPNPCHARDMWLPNRAWIQLLELEELPAFRGFVKHFRGCIKSYRLIYESEDPAARLDQLLGPVEASPARRPGTSAGASLMSPPVSTTARTGRTGGLRSPGTSQRKSLAPKEVDTTPSQTWFEARNTGGSVVDMSDASVSPKSISAGFSLRGSGRSAAGMGLRAGNSRASFASSGVDEGVPPPSSWQRLLILRALRPDAVVSAVQRWVAESLGPQYIDPPTFDLGAAFADSTCATPLIFVLGADPMTELFKFADDRGFVRKLKSISLGQGQGPIAEDAIAEAIDSGSWVCLQNCHLAVSWLPTLERICENITPARTHPEFRLWLTSKPAPAFPVSVLQNGVKMVNEPRQGIRANMLGNYSSFQDTWLETCAAPVTFKRLLFGLCFFHAHMLERRKFGPLGFNKPYEFSTPDLHISIAQLRMFLDAEGADVGDAGVNVPFKTLQYLTGECNYGGRVTDDWDRRTTRAILDDCFGPATLLPGFQLAPDDRFIAPSDGDMAAYMAAIRALPMNDATDVFGLHANANIAVALAETNALLGAAHTMQSNRLPVLDDDEDDVHDMDEVDGSGESADEGSAEAAGPSRGGLQSLLRDIVGRLPDNFDVEQAAAMYPIDYSRSMNTVLVQELMRYNRLLTAVRSTSELLRKALRGLAVMSPEIEEMSVALQAGHVPEAWAKAAYPSLKPLGSWVTDLVARVDFFTKWINEGPPACFWISGFYFTQSFLTGTLQDFARNHRLPIDTLEFEFEVLDTPVAKLTQPPEDGAYVHGLFLYSAAWDRGGGYLREPDPRVLSSPLPVLHLKPSESSKVVRGKHTYLCPVYKTSARTGTLSTTGHSTNFVLAVKLPMSRAHHENHWVKRGVALLCSLDD